MKRIIETLVKSWVCDNREYIEENFIDVEDYLLSWIGEDNWAYDFFNNEEIENNTEEQLEYETRKFASFYSGIFTCDLLDNIEEIFAVGDDCEEMTEKLSDERLVAIDSYYIYKSDSWANGHYSNIFSKLLENGGNIRQFAKFYGFGVYDNKFAGQLECYKL